MKTSNTCPKCQCQKIWQIDTVQHPEWEYSNTVHAMPVTAHVADSFTPRIDAGQFEARVCSGCGYTEWYAKRFEADFAKLGDAGVRLVDGSAGGVPYR